MTPSAYPPPMKRSRFQGARRACTALLVSVLAGCALTPEVPLRPDTIYVITGEAIAIPSDLTREQLSDYIALAQQAMDRLSEQVERMLSGKQPPPTEIDNRVAA